MLLKSFEMEEIRKIFNTDSKSISDFFHERGVAYSVPPYQRAYSWDEENIDQLMEDISFGVEDMIIDQDEIRFMGTIILVPENDRRRICPDEKAQPTRIDNIIDGQQRISTIALLGTLLYGRLINIKRQLPSDNTLDEWTDLPSVVDRRLGALSELFSVDLGVGVPKCKPKVIREVVDQWTFNGSEDDYYKSAVTNYLARVIRALHEHKELPAYPIDEPVGPNLKRMNGALKQVAEAHLENDKGDGWSFPAAWQILAKSENEAHVWGYGRPKLREYVGSKAKADRDWNTLCSLVQLLSFAHYLLDRCCFTVIDTRRENWAFDMFQSLNATGTPLTAIETFKPMVIGLEESDATIAKKRKLLEEEFLRVDRLFGDTGTAASKNRLTNEYLTTFAHCQNGTKLARQFSHQRKWLTDLYKRQKTFPERQVLLQHMGDLADYYRELRSFKSSESMFFEGFPPGVPVPDKVLATTCVLYLHSSNHRMAHAILGQFYSRMIHGEENGGPEFVKASKAVAAFFTLWRSALPNAGLDDAYRQILKTDRTSNAFGISWEGRVEDLNTSLLVSKLRQALTRRSVGSEGEWLTRAKKNYSFDEAKQVCRFGLFLSAEDTVPDEDHPGLMKQSTVGSSPEYLTPLVWQSKNMTVEHVAPQKPPEDGGWDQLLYQPDAYHLIGNLTLLPGPINYSAGNRNWISKWFYYSHLAEKRKDVLDTLAAEASKQQVPLNPATTDMLKATPHNHHMIPIVQVVPPEHIWDFDLVQARTQRICEIVWDRMWNNWLS